MLAPLLPCLALALCVPSTPLRSAAADAPTLLTALEERMRGVVEPVRLPAADIDAHRAIAALETTGVVRIDGVLSAAAAAEMRTFVNDSLESALAATAEAPDFGDVWQEHFGNIMSRTHRHDVKLDFTDPPVRDALSSLLTALEMTIEGPRTPGLPHSDPEPPAPIAASSVCVSPVHPPHPTSSSLRLSAAWRRRRAVRARRAHLRPRLIAPARPCGHSMRRRPRREGALR